jgi:hypothetical protein
MQAGVTIIAAAALGQTGIAPVGRLVASTPESIYLYEGF